MLTKIRTLTLFLFLACTFIGLVPSRSSMQVNQKVDRSSGAAGRNLCWPEKEERFTVKCKARYFFGESPLVTISITNTSRSKRTVKDAEHQKFSFEMTGVFQNGSGQKKETATYDGSWDIPKEPTRAPKPGETYDWLPLRKREPKFVALSRGESTDLELDLSEVFRSYLGVGEYKLMVKSEEGQKVVKEFEVYFDKEKSGAFLTAFIKSGNDLDRMLADERYSYFRRTFSTGESSRIWALYRFAEFDKKGLIVLLEELAKSGNEDQRRFANNILSRIKAGKPLT